MTAGDEERRACGDGDGSRALQLCLVPCGQIDSLDWGLYSCPGPDDLHRNNEPSACTSLLNSPARFRVGRDLSLIHISEPTRPY